MKCIGTITDKEILGTEGLSSAKPRITARAIVRNNYNLFAVLYACDFNLYSLPGGGVENEETLNDALRREISEETGVNVLSIKELGYVEENRAHCDYTQVSYYFVVLTDSDKFHEHLTPDEAKHGTSVDWYSFEDAYNRIAHTAHETIQRKFLQARDVCALNEYKKQYEIRK